MSLERPINEYTCRTCGMTIRTIDRDEGVTPMMINCRATKDCDGTMFSSMYRTNQTYPPQFEWYKPAKLPKDRDMREYIEMGGLMIRSIKGKK